MRLTVRRREGGEPLWSGPAGSEAMGLAVGDVVVLEECGPRVRVVARSARLEARGGDPAGLALTLTVDELD